MFFKKRVCNEHSFIWGYPIPSHPIRSHPITSHFIVSYRILSYPMLPCPVLSYPILSYRALSSPGFMSSPVLSCPVPFFPVLYYPVLSCPVVSCLVLSFPVLSCPVLFSVPYPVLISFVSTGLMADNLGSYTATFYTAGAVLIAGASVMSLMTFVKHHPEEIDEIQSYEDEELLVTERLTVL